MPAGAREIQAVRRCYARHNEGDDTGWLEIFDEDLVMRSRGVSFFEDGTWRGRDEVAREFTSYFASFSNFRFFVHELVQFGDWVLADVTHQGRGRISEIELGVRSAALYRFRRGKVVEFVVVPTRADAYAVLRR